MVFVVTQGVFVSDRAGAGIKAGDLQGVAQICGDRIAGQATGVEHHYAADGQAAKAVRDADVKGPGLGQSTRIRIAAVGQIGLVDTGVSAVRLGRQSRDIHRVIRRGRRRRRRRRRRRFALNRYGQGRGIGIAVGIGDRIGKYLGLVAGQATVGGIDIAAVGVQHQGAELAVDDGAHAGAVGDGRIQVLAGDDAGDGGAGAVCTGHVGLDAVEGIVVGAGEDVAAGAAAGADFIDIRNRIGNVIDDAHREHLFGGVAVAVGENNRQVVEQVIGALPLRMRFVVAQGVFVGDGPGLRIVAGDHQGVAQRRGDRIAGQTVGVEHQHAAKAQAAQPVGRADGEAAGLGQGRRIGRAAIGQVGFVDADVTALDGRGQATDRHAVVRGRRWRRHHGLGDQVGVGGRVGQRRRRIIRIKAGLGVAGVGIAFEADAGGDGIAGAATLTGRRGLQLCAQVTAFGERFLQFAEFRVFIIARLRVGGSLAGGGRALRGRVLGVLAGRRFGSRLRRLLGGSAVTPLVCRGCRRPGVPLCDLGRGRPLGFLLLCRLNRLALFDFVVHRPSP